MTLPRRAREVYARTDDRGTVLYPLTGSAPAKPRRAQDEDAFDDHQLLLVAIEQLAVEFTATGLHEPAAQLRDLARAHS